MTKRQIERMSQNSYYISSTNIKQILLSLVAYQKNKKSIHHIRRVGEIKIKPTHMLTSSKTKRLWQEVRP